MTDGRKEGTSNRDGYGIQCVFRELDLILGRLTACRVFLLHRPCILCCVCDLIKVLLQILKISEKRRNRSDGFFPKEILQCRRLLVCVECLNRLHYVNDCALCVYLHPARHILGTHAERGERGGLRLCCPRSCAHSEDEILDSCCCNL